MPNDRFINSYPLDAAIFRLGIPAGLIALGAVIFYYGTTSLRIIVRRIICDEALGGSERSV